jgi:hypothetical protein
MFSMTRFPVFYDPRHFGRFLAVGFATLAIVVTIYPIRAEEPSATQPPKSARPNPITDAMKTLADKGLTKLKASPASIITWVLPDDAKVHEKLADLRKWETAQHKAAKKVKDEASGTAKDRDTLAKAEARYQELKGYADKPDSIPRKIAARFRSPQEMQQALENDLRTQIMTINELKPKLMGKFAGDMAPSLKTAITDWMTARNNLILAYLAVEANFSELDKQYQALAEDPDVAAALQSLGKKNHLGSAGFEQDKKAMAATAATALSGEVPFYREGSYDSVGALLNETTAIIIRIESVNPQAVSWAPTEVLTKAGIAIDPAAPLATLTFGGAGKRTIQCRQVVVPKLRLGKYVLEDVKFLAMPDDAKDLGTQIANSELKGYDQTPDQSTWLYKFVKQGEPAPEEKKEDKKPAKSEKE